ncbi:MAG: DUF3221 domain-containing protein [Clostridia bacterium]|nr:DUF3221 domain-containing protein [Clostridia bacterium]
MLFSEDSSVAKFELKEGDVIRIYFNGGIMESAPSQIYNVQKVEIFDRK